MGTQGLSGVIRNIRIVALTGGCVVDPARLSKDVCELHASFAMKKPKVPARSGLGEKITLLKQKLSAARSQSEKARAIADRAKVEFKRVRKTFKAAKHSARDARKKVKAWKKILAAAVQAATPKPAASAARAKPTPKTKPAKRAARLKTPKPKSIRPSELPSAALSLGDQSSSGSTPAAAPKLPQPGATPSPESTPPPEASPGS
jgi:hypothetical protein